MSDPPVDKGQAGKDGKPSLDVHHAQGILIGDGRQTNYFYVVSEDARGVAGPPGITFSGEIESPYRGLIAFGKQDAAFFFGREAPATEILERLSALRDAPAMLVVSGASGAGKSSLLQAGVLPHRKPPGSAATGRRPV